MKLPCHSVTEQVRTPYGLFTETDNTNSSVHRTKRNVFSEDDIRIENKNGKEIFIYDPYNPINRMITPREIETILQNYGINVPINHFELYKRAFIHRSYTKSPLLYDSTNSKNDDVNDMIDTTIPVGGKNISEPEIITSDITNKHLPNLSRCLQPPTKLVLNEVHETCSPSSSLEDSGNTNHPGYCGNIQIMPKPFNCLPLFTKSNERLEFVGDGVLECITKFYLYRRFPKENEGFMTEKKIALVKNEAIGRIAYEMGLHKWFILSKNTEEKQTRTNLKKLGCLFESFLGAIFLDFNKIKIHDEDGWFDHVFLTGPGFQMVQIFVENVFEKHVNWIDLIRNDDNYKNILQVKIQKAFKVTPDYLEISPYNNETGYYMGVYLCLGQSIHGLNHSSSVPIQQFVSIQDIHNYMSIHGKVLVFLGEGKHKIKKKAEQIACESAVMALG
jgi:dsRNA-specific ribonuclease